MRSNTLLVLLTALCSAACWWPLAVEPGLDLPLFVPFLCVALCTGLATALAPRSWLFFVVVSSIGAFGDLSLSYSIWLPSDPIAVPWISYAVAIDTLATLLCALSAALLMRKIPISNQTLRRAAWVATLACVAFGPVTFVLTPSIVQYRIARNDRRAAERFASLKNAVERTAAEEGLDKICDGSALQRHYSGLPFSGAEWRFITSNYVKQDGYTFMIYCCEKDGYVLDAGPAREHGDGTRRFCADQSHRIGCRIECDRSRNECLPCPK